MLHWTLKRCFGVTVCCFLFCKGVIVKNISLNYSVISFLNFQNGDVISYSTVCDIVIVGHVHIIKQERMSLYKICPSVYNRTKLQFIRHRFLQQPRYFRYP